MQGGVVVTDALNHGLPVISTRIGGIPTLLKHNQNGWLVSPKSTIGEISELLQNLTQSMLETVSQKASTDAKERLTWETWSKDVLELCTRITS
ncbi:glycosyltransferase [Rothia sp. CCM 9417]|uniref:glycosyltransferase n=1 Tax=Rothia sp. CCM 9417 TaxID=3402657 RepID=UPI003ADC0182